ncbi:MAG: WG repeat-containing protein [Bacteroidales bacterium]
MRKFLFLSFILFGSQVFSQEYRDVLVPYLSNGKYGYLNSSGQKVITPKYDFAYPFFLGYALSLVIENNTPALINRKGQKVFKVPMGLLKRTILKDIEKVIPENPGFVDLEKTNPKNSCPKFGIFLKTEYNRLFDKVGDLYIVTDFKKYFLINAKGDVKSDGFDKIRHIVNSEIEYCITEDSVKNKKGLLDRNGKQLLECTYNNIVYNGNGVFLVYDNNSKHEFKVKYEKIENQELKNNIPAKEIFIRKKNGKTGALDTLNNQVISFNYDKLYPLKNKTFIYKKGEEYGIIDSAETRLFWILNDSADYSDFNNKPKYLLFTDSLIFFNKSGIWQLVDSNGKIKGEKFECIYVDFQKQVDAICGVTVNSKVGVINRDAEYLISPIYDEIICIGENQSFLVRSGNSWNWLDREAHPIYENFEAFSYFLMDHLLVKKDKSWYFVNLQGVEFKK